MDAVPNAPRLLTLKGKRGLILRPLVWGASPPPLIDESLLGLVTRISARNGFSSVSRVLRLADIDCRYVSILPTHHAESAANLATLLRVTHEDVSSRMHSEQKIPGKRAAYIDFHGSIIKARYRENIVRRASPRSLTLSPHHRATWDLRPFSFCMDTHETLLTACPVCRRQLGWRTTYGIPHCHVCLDVRGRPAVDLRDFPQPTVTVRDDTALGFLCDLVHPDGTRRDRARRELAIEFSNVAPGDLLDVVVAIACAIAGANSHSTTLRKFGSLEGYSLLTPEVMTRAARPLLNWPSALVDLGMELRAAGRTGNSGKGMLKEMGPLSTIAWNTELGENVRSTFKQGNVAFMTALDERTAGLAKLRLGLLPEGFVTLSEAARRIGVKSPVLRRISERRDVTVVMMNADLKGPTLYLSVEIDEIARVRADLIPWNTAARRLGMPLRAMADLDETGILKLERGPAADLGWSKPMLRATSLEALLSAMRARVLPRRDDGRKDRSLRSAVAGSARLDMPWAEIVRAILEGTLNLRDRPAERGGFIAGVALVDRSQFDALMTQAAGRTEDGRASMSYDEAAIALGTQSFTVCKLNQAGLLGNIMAHDRRITSADVDAFKEAYAFTPEVACMLRTKAASVRKILGRMGIMPAAEMVDGKRLIWCRKSLARAVQHTA